MRQPMNLKNVSAAALLIFFSCNNAPISGKGLSDIGFYLSPEKTIAELEAGPKGSHEHFLLGCAYEKEKKYKKSILNFANSAFSSHRDFKLRLFAQPVYQFVKGYHVKSDYYDDVMYELAYLFSLYGDHAFTVKFVDLMSHAHTALYRDAVLLKARSLSVLKNYTEALSQMKKLLDDFDDPESRAVIFLRTGSILEKKSDIEGAITNYLSVFANDVKGWQASSAAELLASLLAQNPKKLKFEENLIFSEALYFGKQYKDAADLLSRLNKEKADRTVIEFLIRSLVRSNAPGAAGALIKEHAGDATQQAALLCIYADELWDMGRKTESLQTYQQVSRAGFEPQARKALQRIAQLMEERKQVGYEQYCTDYKNKYSDDRAGNFLWLLGRNMVRAKNTERALLYLEESVSKYPRGSYSDESRFWLHKIYSQKKEIKKTLSVARDLAVTNPDSPYTWLLLKQLAQQYTASDLDEKFHKAVKENNDGDALFYHSLLFMKEKSLDKRTGRISALGSPDIERYKSLERAIAGMKTSSGYHGVLKNIEKYFVIGHSAGIARELTLLPKTREAIKDKYIALAYYARKYHFAYFEVYSSLELLKLFRLKENITLMPEETVTSLFPKPFGECISRYASRYSVDKNVIYAVMKAESLFKHNAVSSAGATGLMQLMPGTARGIARGLRLEGYELADPCASIQLGSKYIAGLMREFGNNFQYMVAAYNAGAGNVDKWKDRFRNEDMDYFTEFTPFIETRYYILRTDKFLSQYELIYADKTPAP
jgi:soluble lytic murein transglycosylase-like protein